MKLVTGQEMGTIDARTTDEYCIPAAILMENAGSCCAQWIASRVPRGASLCILCGSGNNGGDGLVAARHLSRYGLVPLVVMVASRSRLSPHSSQNLCSAEKLGLDIRWLETEQQWSDLQGEIRHCSLIVDALLGTGTRGTVQGLKARIMEDCNRSPLPRVAIDVPSGLVCDGTPVHGPLLRASATLTMGLPKLGMQSWPGTEACGTVIVFDIGFPSALITDESLSRTWLDMNDARDLLPQRPPNAHKGSMGRVLVLGGSSDYPGAPILAGLGALYGGCGLVEVLVPGSGPHAGQMFPDLISRPIQADSDGGFSPAVLPAVRAAIASASAVVIGPGMGRSSGTGAFLSALLPDISVPLVLDADGINHVAAQPGLLRNLPPHTVLTPHPGEFARLLGQEQPPSTDLEREQEGSALARKSGALMVLKDAATLIASPEGRLIWSRSGHSSMARGGMGDVLSGLIGAFLARGMERVAAASLAVYCHGRAGCLLADEGGADGVSASRLAEAVPRVLDGLAHCSGEQPLFQTGEPCLWNPLEQGGVPCAL